MSCMTKDGRTERLIDFQVLRNVKFDYLKFSLLNIVIDNSIEQMIAENSHVKARTSVSSICMIIQMSKMKTFRITPLFVEKIFNI